LTSFAHQNFVIVVVDIDFRKIKDAIVVVKQAFSHADCIQVT
jgi:hypothetical protein